VDEFQTQLRLPSCICNERGTAARLFLTRVQFVEGTLQLFQLLSSLA
jgi:hypothetical protein